MDKKSIVNDLYHASLISIFTVAAGKEDIENGSPKHSEIRSGGHKKTRCYHNCIRDHQKVSY